MNRAHELYPPIAGWTPQSRIMTVDVYVHYVACKSKYLSPRTLQKIIRIATRNGLTCSYCPYGIVSGLCEAHRGDTLRYLICRYPIIDEAFREYVVDADHTGIIWHHPRMYHDDYMRTFMIDRYYDLVAPHLSSVDLHALIASANIFGTFMVTKALRDGDRERLPYPEPSAPRHRCPWQERTCIIISNIDRNEDDYIVPYSVKDERHRRRIYDNLPLCDISKIIDDAYATFGQRDAAYIMTLIPVTNITATGSVIDLVNLHQLGFRFDFWEDLSLIGALLAACHEESINNEYAHARRDDLLCRPKRRFTGNGRHGYTPIPRRTGELVTQDDMGIVTDHFYRSSNKADKCIPCIYRIGDILDMWDILRVNRQSIKEALVDSTASHIPSNIFKYLHLPPLRIYADDFVDVAQHMTKEVAAMIYDTKAVYFYELCVRSGHVDASVINPREYVAYDSAWRSQEMMRRGNAAMRDMNSADVIVITPPTDR